MYSNPFFRAKNDFVPIDNFDQFLFEPPYYPPPVTVGQEVIDTFVLSLTKGSPVGFSAEDSLQSLKDASIRNDHVSQPQIPSSSSTTGTSSTETTSTKTSSVLEQTSTSGTSTESSSDSSSDEDQTSETDNDIKVNPESVQRMIGVDTDDPVQIVQEGARFVSDVSQLLPLMHKTMDVLKKQTQSFDAMLYFVTQAKNEIYLAPRKIVSRYYITNWKIGKESTISAYVAYTKTGVLVEDVWVDQRFPLGIGYKDLRVKAALGFPILSPEQELLGVIELTKREDCGCYTVHDMQLVLMICAWFGNVIYQREHRVYEDMQLSTLMSLVDLSSTVTQMLDEDMIIYDVLDICLHRLKAKAGYYYAFIPSDEGILAEVYEYDKVLPARLRRRRRLDDAIGTAASYVARTHKMLNIRDVALDKRFNEIDDFVSHFSLTNILCQEIRINGKPVGILQINNKTHNGVFVHQDEILYNIICSYLSHLLELREIRKVSKRNIMMNKFARDIINHHITPCSHCQQVVTSTGRPIPWKLQSWDWTPVWDGGHMVFSTALCLMLCQVLTPASVRKHRLDVLILTMNKFYHILPKEQWMAAFFRFHMTFCLLARNRDTFRFTEIVGVLVCVLFGQLDSQLQNVKEKRIKTKAVLNNKPYHLLMTLLRSLQVCEKLPNITRNELKQEFKTLVPVLNTPLTTPIQSPVEFRSYSENSSLESYLTDMIQTELGSDSSTDRFNAKQLILQSSIYHLFVRHYNYVVEHHEALTPFYPILGYPVIPSEDWEGQFSFIIRFIQLVVLPKFEALVEHYPNCSDILDLCTKLKVNYERALAGDPIADWKLEI